jgi:hypothetical protein
MADGEIVENHAPNVENPSLKVKLLLFKGFSVLVKAWLTTDRTTSNN